MSGLRGEWNGSRSRQGGGEAGEDHEVGVKLDLLDTANAERAEAPLVLQPAELALDGDQSLFKSDDDYVFAFRVGTPLHWRNVSRRALKPALEKAGIEPLRWHDLRHTFASLLIAGGANVVFVSRQLGHGSSDIMLRVYSHLLDRAEQAQRTREILQEMLGGVV